MEEGSTKGSKVDITEKTSMKSPMVDVSQDGEESYPPLPTALVIFSVASLSLLLTSLDQTIVSTAIPAIVSKFNSLEQVAWIPGAYFLTQAAFMVVTGQFLELIPTKTVFLFAITTFELGSLICGVANSMPLLIFGRALSGVGGAALYPSCTAVIVQVSSLRQRPLFMAALGIEIAVGIIVGPLLGGVFTDHVTWRWCFYINLPIGALAVLGVIFLLPSRAPRSSVAQTPHSPRSSRLGRLLHPIWTIDIVGTFLSLILATCLVLGLQWGGVVHPWDSAPVITLIVLFGAFFLVFVLWEKYRGENAIVPGSMFKRRCQWGAMFQAFFIGAGLYIDVYYLPLWYQVKGHTAIQSGIDLLPFLLSVIVVAGITGGLINAWGRYWYIIVIFPLIYSVGSGFLYAVDFNESLTRLIGFQIICGVGIGGVLQNGLLPVHVEYATEQHKIPKGIAMVSLTQLTGALVGVSVANSVFSTQLSYLLADRAPHLPAAVMESITHSVAAIFALPEEDRTIVSTVYAECLSNVLIIGVPCGVLAAVGGSVTRNLNMKEHSRTVDSVKA